MQERYAIALALTVPLFLGIACDAAFRGPGYDTDVPPPSGRETYSEVFPADLGGLEVRISALPLDASRYHGAVARYGELARIEIVGVDDPADLDEYAKRHVRPLLSAYPNRNDAKVDGRWLLEGRGNGRLYAWQNANWLFLIEARTDGAFDEAVQRFAWIHPR